MRLRTCCPPQIIHRKKMGFPTPWEYGLAGPKLQEIETLLLESRSVERRPSREDAVRRIFTEHRAKRRDHGSRIWRLLNLELWQRTSSMARSMLSSARRKRMASRAEGLEIGLAEEIDSRTEAARPRCSGTFHKKTECYPRLAAAASEMCGTTASSN